MDMDDTYDEMEVVRVYNGVVGELISKLTRQIHLDQGILRVKVASPALRNELSYKKESLKERINSLLDRKVVKEIQFC